MTFNGFRKCIIMMLMGFASVTFVVPVLAEDDAVNMQKRMLMMKMMKPMMKTMLDGMMNGMLELLAAKETAQYLATFNKNYYDALIAKGFTKDEALKIITSMGIPSVPTFK